MRQLVDILDAPVVTVNPGNFVLSVSKTYLLPQFNPDGSPVLGANGTPVLGYCIHHMTANGFMGGIIDPATGKAYVGDYTLIAVDCQLQVMYLAADQATDIDIKSLPRDCWAVGQTLQTLGRMKVRTSTPCLMMFADIDPARGVVGALGLRSIWALHNTGTVPMHVSCAGAAIVEDVEACDLPASGKTLPAALMPMPTIPGA